MEAIKGVLHVPLLWTEEEASEETVLPLSRAVFEVWGSSLIKGLKSGETFLVSEACNEALATSGVTSRVRESENVV